MSVFKTDEPPLEKRVKALEKRVKQIEILLGKKPSKESDDKNVKEEEEDFCVIT
tara:strand:+ start:2675 stop:2836 length:162 start_codon:yes stop_codon:yes gene_type:complete